MIEPGQRAAQGEQASAELDAALAQAEDARKGQRPVELGILEAERDAAAAAAREARILLNRTEALVRRGIYARVRLDEARAAHRDRRGPRSPPRPRRVEAATLGQREDADPGGRRARLPGTGAKAPRPASGINDMAPAAPGPARVEEVFYQRGEWAAANQPIVALIPDDRVYVRFFVPEQAVAAYRPGTRVRFRCDGCPDDLAATITYVSPRPEFTPPIIYSREARDRLVFMVEARPENGAAPRSRAPGRRLPAGPSTMTVAIHVEDLNKSFGGRRVVKDFSIDVEQGRITGFLGPNGSGKTTTLRMLCGLLTPDSGSGTALGFDILAESWEIKRRTGYMTQRFSLYEDLTVEENLQFSARIRSLDRSRERIDEALEQLGLAERRRQLAGHPLGRLEAAPRAGRRDAARAAAAAARRAHRRRRSAGAPRLLGRDPRARRDAASPSSSRPITWTRPSAATTSPISLMARCSRAAPPTR